MAVVNVTAMDNVYAGIRGSDRLVHRNSSPECHMMVLTYAIPVSSWHTLVQIWAHTNMLCLIYFFVPAIPGNNCSMAFRNETTREVIKR